MQDVTICGMTLITARGIREIEAILADAQRNNAKLENVAANGVTYYDQDCGMLVLVQLDLNAIPQRMSIQGPMSQEAAVRIMDELAGDKLRLRYTRDIPGDTPH